MAAEPKKTGVWSGARKHLATWEKPALLALVKELYELAKANRDFIQARCQAESGGGEVLESYRRRIVEQFFPARGYGKLKLAEAHKAIRDYRKATGNLAGTVELLLTLVENGTEFTRTFGDIDERFYRSVEGALEQLAGLLQGEAEDIYPQVADRLEVVRQKAKNVGWGYADFVGMVVEELDTYFDAEDTEAVDGNAAG